MRTVALIPARYDSERFPGKPLIMIHGKPMIQHVYERALVSQKISRVYVATDDERIRRCVKDFGGEAIMTEKRHSTGTDRIAEAIQILGLTEDHIVINIQGDQPLIHAAHITDLLDPFLRDGDVPMSTLKYRIRDQNEIKNSNHVKVVTDEEGYALYFSRSAIPFFRDSEGDRIYYKHLGFYAYRIDFLIRFAALPAGKLEKAERLEQLRALEHGFKIMVVETAFDSIEVDTPSDIQRVEKLMMESSS